MLKKIFIISILHYKNLLILFYYVSIIRLTKYNRTGFRHNFTFNNIWRGKYYKNKQLEVYAVQENAEWIVITIITRYF